MTWIDLHPKDLRAEITRVVPDIKRLLKVGRT